MRGRTRSPGSARLPRIWSRRGTNCSRINPEECVSAAPTAQTPEPAHGGTAWSRLKAIGLSLYRAGVAWVDDNATRLSAAVAMYTILSLSPFLVITIKVLAVAF